MQTVDEDQQDQDTVTETLHLYVVREPLSQPTWHLWLPVVLSLFCLSVLFTLCVLFPYRQQVERATLRVPAAFSPLQHYTATAPIIATGIKTYPAIPAHGTITIYNGSILAQEIPQGMILTSRNGIEIITDTSVYVPAGNPPNFGIATVQAHAALAGVQGNIAAWAINQSFGVALYIRNLSAFHGGKDAYSVQVVTEKDIQIATNTARATAQKYLSLRKDNLASPCTESVKQTNSKIFLTWACQFYTFSIPARFHITSFQLIGRNVVVAVFYVKRPVIRVYK